MFVDTYFVSCIFIIFFLPRTMPTQECQSENAEKFARQVVQIDDLYVGMSTGVT